MATERQRRGSLAEDRVATYLAELGWRLVSRNVRVGRDEIDLVAVDPGPPIELVLVEARSASSPAFGMPEERVDRAKVSHLYRAAGAFVRSSTARELGLTRLSVRVDLVIVDRTTGRTALRHLRRLEPA